jgi:hypothetical protein
VKKLLLSALFCSATMVASVAGAQTIQPYQPYPAGVQVNPLFPAIAPTVFGTPLPSVFYASSSMNCRDTNNYYWFSFPIYALDPLSSEGILASQANMHGASIYSGKNYDGTLTRVRVRYGMRAMNLLYSVIASQEVAATLPGTAQIALNVNNPTPQIYNCVPSAWLANPNYVPTTVSVLPTP